VKFCGHSFISFMYNVNGNHVEHPKCNIKLWCRQVVLLSATFNNIAVTLTCLLQEWETESVVLERVSFIWVIEQA